ncbi:MAG: invasion associated locus B family protein [Pseudomonadota bacterium]|nr:invasion associated locus B family protein [Pseudomonadota bacterium]
MTRCRRSFAATLTSLVCTTLIAGTLAAQARAQTEGELQGPPAPAAAPDRIANGQTYGAWSVACQALAINETTCVLEQQLYRDTDRAFIARIMAFWSGDGEGMYMSAQVPTGVALPSGFAMRPASGGDDDVIQMAYQTCDGTVCEAITRIEPTFVDGTDTEDGQNMVASFRPGLTAEPFVFRFSAAGLSQGLAALKPVTTN